DVIGAGWHGYTTFWINRQGAPLDELGAEPDFTGALLTDVLAAATGERAAGSTETRRNPHDSAHRQVRPWRRPRPARHARERGPARLGRGLGHLLEGPVRAAPRARAEEPRPAREARRAPGEDRPVAPRPQGQGDRSRRVPGLP